MPSFWTQREFLFVSLKSMIFVLIFVGILNQIKGVLLHSFWEVKTLMWNSNRVFCKMLSASNTMPQRLKHLAAMKETWVRSLGQEKETATHSSILAWRIPWMEECGGLQSTGRKESDMTERLHFPIILMQRITSQQDPLWPTSQNIGNKSKNKQMGPN